MAPPFGFLNIPMNESSVPRSQMINQMTLIAAAAATIPSDRIRFLQIGNIKVQKLS